MGQKVEARGRNEDRNRAKILGVGVDSTSASSVLSEISSKVSEKVFIRPLFIVTVYSENILESESDRELAAAMEKADLVVPDGVSVVAAKDYLLRRKNKTLADLWLGFEVGWKILKGEYADKKVVGVDLTKSLLRKGGEKGWRIFLLGGWGGVGEKIVKMMRRDFPGVKIECDEGQVDIKSQITNGPSTLLRASKSETNTEIINRINNFQPDILLVAFGRFKQEKWIARNLERLRARVVMGVGSSFDELASVGPWATPTPSWANRMGLKWLWRVSREPKHIKRAWNAFPVFAWKVFRSR